MFLLRRIAMLIPPQLASRGQWPVAGLGVGDSLPRGLPEDAYVQDGLVVLLEGTPYDYGAASSALVESRSLGQRLCVLYNDAQQPGTANWLQQFGRDDSIGVFPLSSAAFQHLDLLVSPVTMVVRSGKVVAAALRLTSPTDVREHLGVYMKGQISFQPLQEVTS